MNPFDFHVHGKATTKNFNLINSRFLFHKLNNLKKKLITGKIAVPS